MQRFVSADILIIAPFFKNCQALNINIFYFPADNTAPKKCQLLLARNLLVTCLTQRRRTRSASPYYIFKQIHIHIQIHIHRHKMEQMEHLFQSLYIIRICKGCFLRCGACYARVVLRAKIRVFREWNTWNKWNKCSNSSNLFQVN